MKGTLLYLPKSALSAAKCRCCVLPSGSAVYALRVGLCGVPVSLKCISALSPGWLCGCIWIM